MLFATERDLQQEIAQVDFNLFNSYPVSFNRREIPVGGCIPDLVSVYFSKDPTTIEWPNKWSYRHSFLIWLLKKWDNLTLHKIASLSYEAPDKMQPVLEELVSSGIIVQTGQDVFVLATHVKQLGTEVVAVEAKLRKWKEALSQAVRYKEFANVVFVAMDAEAAPTTLEILHQFENLQVGLCAISLGSIEWLVFPEERHQGIGHEKEYLTMSAAIPTTQKFWALRKKRNASNHA